MIIERNGQRIELTPSELCDAYDEQQFNYDREDVITLIDSMDDLRERYDIEREEITDDIISAMAVDMRRMINKYDCDWDYARDEAVRNALWNMKTAGEGLL